MTHRGADRGAAGADRDVDEALAIANDGPPSPRTAVAPSAGSAAEPVAPSAGARPEPAAAAPGGSGGPSAGPLAGADGAWDPWERINGDGFPEGAASSPEGAAPGARRPGPAPGGQPGDGHGHGPGPGPSHSHSHSPSHSHDRDHGCHAGTGGRETPAGHAVHTGGPGPSGTPSAPGAPGALGAREARAGHRHGAMPWSEARATAARAVRGPLAPEVRQLPDALGTVLAEPLTALTDLPSFDSSAMDGWAVSGPGPWRIATGGHGVLAGDDGLVPLEDGHAVRIATGARVPPGTTGVLRSEYGEIRRRPARGPEDGGHTGGNGGGHTGGNGGGHTGTGSDGAGSRGGRDGRDGTNPPTGGPHGPEHGTTGAPAPGDASLHTTGGHTVVPGQDIRPRGQECRSGDRLLAAGTAVTPAVLGLAAAAGYDELRTVRRPRVEVLVLGDELLHSGLPRDGRIRDALGPMLGPWLETLGAEVTGTYRLGDDAEVLHTAVTASDADVIVTTGGTAAGPVDHVHPVLRRSGAEVLVDGVAVRPGHPMLLARLAPGRHLVGLPGNPLAAVSGLLTLVEPLLRALSGRAPRAAAYVPLAEGAPGHPRDTRLVPVVRRTGTPAASPSGRSGHPGGRAPGSRGAGARSSGNTGAGTGHRAVPLRFNGPAMLRGIAAADGLAVVPPGGAEDGSMAEILELPWFEGETE
ncbi:MULTISPECIES: molybdopterin molybdotransferase MoeA [Streptomyces]|nr:molybdopterin molybdotransferase MoeA [Streptomyces xinghaiensis]KNE79508.1 hypothetical protein ADZ36_27095 [Streptomyces fradiae]